MPHSVCEPCCMQNVVTYSGTKEDRDIIRKREFEFSTRRRQKEVRADCKDVLILSM